MSIPSDWPRGRWRTAVFLELESKEEMLRPTAAALSPPTIKGLKYLSERHQEMKNLSFSLVLRSPGFPLISSLLEIWGAHSHPARELLLSPDKEFA